MNQAAPAPSPIQTASRAMSQAAAQAARRRTARTIAASPSAVSAISIVRPPGSAMRVSSGTLCEIEPAPMCCVLAASCESTWKSVIA
jgi:hypothetical protein